MKHRSISVVWILLFDVVLTASILQAEEWPQWRGPGRDGVWQETGLIRNLSDQTLAIRWRSKIGSGYSGPTVASGRVYVMDRISQPTQLEQVHCFDAMTGRQIWSHSYSCEYKNVAYPNGPRASVTIDNNRAYALGTMGNFRCLDATTGEVFWAKDLKAEYEIRMPPWGIAASPLIEKDLVIVQIGGKDQASLVAFDKISGQQKWRALDDPINYSSPIVIQQGGKRVLVSWTAKRLTGLDAATGNLYWQQPFSAEMGIATPCFQNGFLFVSSFFDGSLLLKLHPDELAISLVWQRKGENEQKTDSLHCCISTPLLNGDYIYGVDSYGELRCLDLRTGNRIWESLEAVPRARWANIHMVQNGDYTWMFNERGELIISKLAPEGFQEMSRAQLINPTLGQLNQRGGVCWAHPAFAYRRVYIRNDEELLCADLAAKGSRR